MVYSASSEDMSMVIRQAVSFGVGFILLFICAQIPPKVYQAISPWFYLFAILLLILVLLVGDVRLGAKRWLTIPGIGSMQPSEFMKFAMPLMMAWYFARNPLPPKFKHIVIALIIMMVPFVLALLQPDLAIGIVIGGVFALFFKWHVVDFNYWDFSGIGTGVPFNLDFCITSLSKEKDYDLI